MIKKLVWYDCPICIHRYGEHEVFAECRSAVGQYGAIVLATIYCKCGFKLAEEIVDNSGNITPSKH
jgi:C4-type Zn-finger protein